MSSSLVETGGMHTDALLAMLATRLAPAARERALLHLDGSRSVDELHVRRAIVIFASSRAADGARARDLARRVHDATRRLVPTSSVIAHPTPASSGAPRRWLGAPATLEPQGDGDAAARLVHAIRCRFAAGADRVVLLGADRADIGARAIDTAFAAMRFSSIVCGPCADGGIYLLGVTQVHAELLARVPWGTGDALAALLRAARECRLSITLLPELPACADGRVASPVM